VLLNPSHVPSHKAPYRAEGEEKPAGETAADAPVAPVEVEEVKEQPFDFNTYFEHCNGVSALQVKGYVFIYLLLFIYVFIYLFFIIYLFVNLLSLMKWSRVYLNYRKLVSPKGLY